MRHESREKQCWQEQVPVGGVLRSRTLFKGSSGVFIFVLLFELQSLYMKLGFALAKETEAVLEIYAPPRSVSNCLNLSTEKMRD